MQIDRPTLINSEHKLKENKPNKLKRKKVSPGCG